MGIELNYTVGEKPFDPSLLKEAQAILGEGSVFLVLRPDGSVWQFEGGEIRNSEIRLIENGRTSVIEAMDRLGITDEPARELAPTVS